jgi:hypothetical protein
MLLSEKYLNWEAIRGRPFTVPTGLSDPDLPLFRMAL